MLKFVRYEYMCDHSACLHNVISRAALVQRYRFFVEFKVVSSETDPTFPRTLSYIKFQKYVCYATAFELHLS